MKILIVAIVMTMVVAVFYFDRNADHPMPPMDQARVPEWVRPEANAQDAVQLDKNQQITAIRIPSQDLDVDRQFPGSRPVESGAEETSLAYRQPPHPGDDKEVAEEIAQRQAARASGRPSYPVPTADMTALFELVPELADNAGDSAVELAELLRGGDEDSATDLDSDTGITLTRPGPFFEPAEDNTD